MLRRLVPFVALFSGCIEYDPQLHQGVDVFTQEPPEAIDILMIVDNSGSMSSYQTQLSGNFQSFITWFVEGNVDYHIAITTTDDGNDPVNVTGAARGAFVGDVITSDMEQDEAEDAFRDQVNVGTSGTGMEVGLKTAYLALTDEDLLDGPNQGFLREEAELSIVFVSDEEDSSPWPVADYINAFFDLKGHRDRDVFNASALTVTDESECTASQAEASSPGTRYVDVATQTHGLVANLCDDDFAGIVTDLSLATSRMTDTYFLTADPDPSTLTVTVEGPDGSALEVPCTDGVWTYDRVVSDGEEVPAVIFASDQLPALGSRLTIRYMYGGGQVDAFCPEAE
jgi:hypothetical protein